MPRRTLIIASVLALAASLLTAGCGGSSATNPGTTAQSRLLAYSHCMHSHGVPSFPDPTSSEGIPKDRLIPLIGTPQFSAASSACKHVMPAEGLGPGTTSPPRHARLVAALSFARCMRGRGFPGFPDPTAQGELTPGMVTAAGIDLHQPALLQAGLACAPVTHGLITRATVQRAVNGG